MSEPDTTTRLNKYLALHKGLSRRQADELIEKGRVTINDHLAVIGARVTTSDRVEVDGKPVNSSTSLIYLALHKPVGHVCSRKQQGSSPTIYELLPATYHALKPVGRLDRDSSGIILLTNDGDFALRMTHPRYTKIKRYEVELDKPLTPLHQQMVADFGVALEDGTSQLALERMDDGRQRWIVIMHEGRNRQIRRTFDALGYEVKKLHRTTFGAYTVGNLLPGQFRIVEKM